MIVSRKMFEIAADGGRIKDPGSAAGGRARRRRVRASSREQPGRGVPTDVAVAVGGGVELDARLDA